MAVPEPQPAAAMPGAPVRERSPQRIGMLRSGRIPAAVIVVACGILLYGFLLSGDFLVASVVVRGVELGDPAEVATTADAIGEPIFSIDAGAAADRVALLPYVEHVSVRTSFPDKVTIAVIERQPVVAWKTGDSIALIDQRGHVLTDSRPLPDGLPSVINELEAPSVGQTLDPAIVASVIAAADTLGEVADALRWTTDDGLVAALRDDRQVIFGSPDRMPMKLAVYQTVAAGGSVWEVLDLREPDRPYYK
ncbi:MAG: FtsQ-type POTRA domain-containing protein [Thermomicrobiales bacterium]|nr:FtsQ-type POTRA domain-containing protein [Thermomicrobiales bacterium]